MKIKWLCIKNYRSCKDVQIEFWTLHALVGANNSGKSSILRALDFLFNPSTKKIDSESFWNKNTNEKIWIEAVFDDLSNNEKETLKGYLRPDNTFHIARSCKLKENTETDSPADEEFEISQHYCMPMPRIEWLREDKINTNNITDWWRNRNDLVFKEQNFVDFIGGARLGVGAWKEKAKEFIEQYLEDEDFEDTWADNPRGYANVLKGTLPHFIFVPAVRDLSEETKVLKTNPFGRLLYEVLDGVTEDQKEDLGRSLENIRNKLNRTGGDNRLESIKKTEKRLNEVLNNYMDADLEIEFQPPNIQMLLTTPKLFADDGFKNIVENKGHGLQRSIIFSILQCYSELIKGKESQKKRTTIFAIEEPELYMHPQAQRNIRDVLKEITLSNDQIIFATHSSLLLDVAYFDEIIRVHAIQTNENGKTVQTHIWQLPMEKMIEDINARCTQATASEESIRELYANAYHPTRSEGFFAKSIILVEGATEQYALPIYAEALGYSLDKLNISVVDCGGKGQMDRLYRIFNELGIPCYMLFDYDKDTSDKPMLQKSVELLALAGEKTDAPESLLVTDKIACFPQKWEIDLSGEIPDIAELTTSARQLLGLKENSKPLIARYIARQLTKRTPPNIPLSIGTIITKAINIKWEGSCLASKNEG